MGDCTPFWSRGSCLPSLSTIVSWFSSHSSHFFFSLFLKNELSPRPAIQCWRSLRLLLRLSLPCAILSPRAPSAMLSISSTAYIKTFAGFLPEAKISCVKPRPSFLSSSLGNELCLRGISLHRVANQDLRVTPDTFRSRLVPESCQAYLLWQTVCLPRTT